jgi:Ca2+-binding RTX toxin-like protein
MERADGDKPSLFGQFARALGGTRMTKTFVPLSLACLLAAASIATAGPAGAVTGATLYIANDPDGQFLYFNAGPGQSNNVKVDVAHTDGSLDWLYTVTDSFPITPGRNCSQPDPADPTTVTCLVTHPADAYPAMTFTLGDGADRIDFSAADASSSGLGVWAIVNGGDGDDVLTATGPEALYGDAGNDTLTDAFIGNITDFPPREQVGAFDSYLDGGDGNDIIHAQSALGGAGDDTMYGTNGDDALQGGTGNDTIYGQAGNDTIFGNSGDDLLYGGPGDDLISGGPGNDTIYGNSGDDVITGGAGTDVLSGGPGNNTVTQ